MNLLKLLLVSEVSDDYIPPDPTHTDYDLLDDKDEKYPWQGALMSLGIVMFIVIFVIIPWCLGATYMIKWLFE